MGTKKDKALLLKQLKQWREETAGKAGLRTDQIFFDSALEELAEHQPEEIADLYDIRGFSAKKVMAYGKTLIELIDSELPVEKIDKETYLYPSANLFLETNDYSLEKRARQLALPEYEERYKEVRKKHPRAYASWENHEDKLLQDAVEAGLGINELCELHQRHEGAIKSRLRKLGLEDVFKEKSAKTARQSSLISAKPKANSSQIGSKLNSDKPYGRSDSERPQSPSYTVVNELDTKHSESFVYEEIHSDRKKSVQAPESAGCLGAFILMVSLPIGLLLIL